MRMPVDDLLSNWAYMVMTSLAWNLGVLGCRDGRRGAELSEMEFRRFELNSSRGHGCVSQAYNQTMGPSL